METYGNCGKEAQDTISRLASHLAISQCHPECEVESRKVRIDERVSGARKSLVKGEFTTELM